MTINNDQPVVGPRRSSNALPKAKLSPKVIITIWWSAVDLIHLNPGETITSEKYVQQIDEMHKKLPHLQQELVNRKGPIFHHDSTQPHIAQPMLQNLGYKVLPHLPLPPDLSCQPTDYYFPKHLFWQFFLGGQENTSATSRRQKMLSKGFSNPDFYATGINKLIYCWQNCADCNGFNFG